MSLPTDGDERQYESPEAGYAQASSSAPRRRASRAGTRSVNTLSASQLERKRQNDRDAQRAIRKRTKDHIEGLERQANEFKAKIDTMQRVNDALEGRLREADARTQQLAQENELLRLRFGNEGYMLGAGGEGEFR